MKLANKLIKLTAKALVVTGLAVSVGGVSSVVSPTVNTVAHADNQTQQVNDASRSTLNDDIRSTVQDKKYPVQNGGYMSGGNLVKNGSVVDDNFGQLTPEGKQQLVGDMVSTANTDTKKTTEKQQQGQSPSSHDVTKQTTQNWIKELQTHPGVGTRLLTNVLQDVHPDYQQAHLILEPFSSPLNTVIAIGVIVVMLLLTLTFVVDLAYLYIPAFNASVEDGDGGDGDKSKFKPSSYVSRDARQAYSDTESNGKNPAFMYLKKRFIGCTILGFCILFLAQGQIWQFVGWIMDLVSGFIGN